MGAWNAGGVGKNRDSEPMPAVNAATSQVLSIRSPEDHGHRTATTPLTAAGSMRRC